MHDWIYYPPHIVKLSLLSNEVVTELFTLLFDSGRLFQYMQFSSCCIENAAALVSASFVSFEKILLGKVARTEE